MTQEELLAQLRDIHLPADTPAAAATGFALWPVIVFALVLSGIWVAGYWRRTAWRRQARASLKTIEAERDLNRRWSSLLTLAAQIARISERPDIVPRSAYQNPQAVTDEDATALAAHLRQEIAR
ncbi:DUF4381 family protein [Candidatus Entotheonella palauensis]|uniref:DUF4381 domain-containing protein n=1 Tax=Candidatus Entotheonella gemina TaxID=1429439 RepID=W4MDT3_9BACT|nr:DUF4381 family protein [Candidatus Entotheonella palauensis]ETX08101.1 MAG: hypothetical protein ETSY2_07375 [Candidatus Entotheonella gemina]